MTVQTTAKGMTVPQRNGNSKKVASSDRDNKHDPCVRNNSKGDTHSETSFSHTKNEHTTSHSCGFYSSSLSSSNGVGGGGEDSSGGGGQSCSYDN